MKYILYILLPFTCLAQVPISEVADTLHLGNGKVQVSITSGPKYYKKLPDSSLWKSIDYRWIDSTTYWVVYKAEYTIRVKKVFNSNDLFDFELPPQDITFQPDDMVVDSSLVYHPQNVTGYLKDSMTIRFDNCYVTGVHYEISAIKGLKINKIIDSTAFSGGYSSIGTPKTFEFKFLIDKEKEIKIKDWDSTKIDYKKKIDLGFKKYEIPEIKSDKELTRKEFKLEQKGNKKYLSKIISVNSFSGLKADITIYSTSSGNYDDRIVYWGGSSWDLYDNDWTGENLIGWNGSGTALKFLTFMYFDMSSVTGTINSATYTNTCTSNYSTNINIVSHSFAAPPSGGAYIDCSTKYSTAQTISSTGVKTWVFNSTGLSGLSSNQVNGYARVAMSMEDACTSGATGTSYSKFTNAEGGGSGQPTLTVEFGNNVIPTRNMKPHIMNMHTP